MSTVTFADVVHQLLSFDRDDPTEALILDLIDTEWFQRLRDISQTANTRLVYMFSEHSRFGHSIGVSYLALSLMKKLSTQFAREISQYYTAVAVAALLHDVGHLAPGSHTAFKAWFPGQPDTHEEIAAQVIQDDSDISRLLRSFDERLPGHVAAILNEDPVLPPWTWEIISGGGWNVDRGNWCIVDSIMAGVNYGRYNIPALTESMMITADGHLALRENRLDAMMHFAVSRHAMYRQIYQHRVLLAADTINCALVQRARDLGSKLGFADDTMRSVLAAETPEALSIETVFAMRESWWRYHLFQWAKGPDAIAADLSKRLLYRSLFKTVRITENEPSDELFARASRAVEACGYDPKYYLHEISPADVHTGDSRQSMPVVMDDGRVRHLTEADPLFPALTREPSGQRRAWLAMPAEAKALLGRGR